ncbi:MAG TPA: hypothetical protein VHC22_33765 [Pirellulales bacterium]|nr:hypothetical protein [Pirellulales bacterium]
MPRQFSLKTLLWLMACVACFFGGQFSKTKLRQRELDELQSELAAARLNLRNTHTRLELSAWHHDQEQERLREWLRYNDRRRKNCSMN